MSAAPETRLQRRALIIVALLALALSWLVHRADDRPAGRQPPSSLADGEGGARALFLVCQDLGLDVQRWMLPLDGARVRSLVVLGGSDAVTEAEARQLLDWVRSGGRLFYAAEPARHDDEPFLEALGAELTSAKRRGASSLAPVLAATPPAQPSAEARDLLAGTPPRITVPEATLDLHGLVAGITSEILVGPDERRASLGLVSAGQGRIMLLADTTAVDNGALAASDLGPVCVRALAHLADGGTLWFDEFHHGYDERAGVVRAVANLLTGTHAGWALLALGAILLLAVACQGVRLGPPLPEPPAPGRSSLEHVEALAGAWRLARAHRRPRTLLLEGLRLRLGLARTSDVPARLDAAAARAPQLRDAVDDIQNAIAGQGADSPEGLLPLADSIDAVLEVEGRSALPGAWSNLT